MMVCLFWTVMVATDICRGWRSRASCHLLLFMATATVLYWGHCAFFTRSMAIMPLADTLYLTANLLVFPLFLLYIGALTTRRADHRLQWLFTLPAIAGGTCCGIVYTLMSSSEVAEFTDLYLYRHQMKGLHGMAMQQAFIHDTSKVFFAILIIPIYIIGRQRLNSYEHLLSDTYSNLENKTLKPLSRLLLTFSVVAVASFTANAIGRHQFTSSPWLLAVPSVLFAALLFAVGYTSWQQRFSIDDIEAEEKLSDNTESMQSQTSELRQRIEMVMMDERLYLQPNLKIADIVQRLGTNRNYVYNAINRETGMSFNEYVNRMRINYAEQLMTLYPDKSITEISEMSGFSSSTSFYRNFKTFKGIGPREFRIKLKH